MNETHPDPGQVTEILIALRDGEAGAWDRLFHQLYGDLKRVAHNQLRRMRPGQTLDTTGLVHEAYLKCVDQSRVAIRDRAHFYAVSARAMRQILVDYARRLGRAKRGGGAKPLELDENRLGRHEHFEQILEVDEALTKLARYSERQARIVEYRYFVGLTEREIGELLSVTSRTVRNEWTRARAWLHEAMSADD